MSLSVPIQFLLFGGLLGVLCGLALPAVTRLLARLFGRLLPSRHFRFHAPRVRRAPSRRAPQRGDTP